MKSVLSKIKSPYNLIYKGRIRKADEPFEYDLKDEEWLIRDFKCEVVEKKTPTKPEKVEPKEK